MALAPHRNSSTVPENCKTSAHYFLIRKHFSHIGFYITDNHSGMYNPLRKVFRECKSSKVFHHDILVSEFFSFQINLFETTISYGMKGLL